MSAPPAAGGFGSPRIHLRTVGSTNDRARKLAIDGAAGGTVVTADEQSAGRGRRGRTWSAPPGKALLYSAILAPLSADHMLLPLAVPLAVCDAIEDVGGGPCQVKWPNDIWIGERKVSGVLIEARPPEWAVIGVGINVSIADGEFPEELRWAATSVGNGAGVEDVLSALNERLGEWVVAPEAEVLEAFGRRDALKGRGVSWKDVASGGDARGADEEPDGSGTADGIDDRGNLVVVTDSGDRVSLGAGEVQLSL